MKYEALITVGDDAENIGRLFSSEDKIFKNKRSSYEVNIDGGKIEFTIQADDATALRATMDAIAKGLKTYENMKGLR